MNFEPSPLYVPYVFFALLAIFFLLAAYFSTKDMKHKKRK